MIPSPTEKLLTSQKLSSRRVDELFAAMLGKLLKTSRFPLDNEKVTQSYLAQALTGLNIDHVRELRLSDSDVVDFWLPSNGDSGAIIEVKMNRVRPPEVMRQLGRYAKHDRVRAIFLISNKAMQVPAAVEGKPVWAFSLGRAWL